MIELLNEYKRTGSDLAKNAIIMRLDNLISKIARQYSNGDSELQHDLRLAILEKFGHYLDKYDVDSGYTFLAFFKKCATNKCLHYRKYNYERYDFAALDDVTDDYRHYETDHATSEIVDRVVEYLKTEPLESVRYFMAVHLQSEGLEELSSYTGASVSSIRFRANTVLDKVRKFIDRG
jgi:DNA-directed RNA polymerase specialized sigma subunit